MRWQVSQTHLLTNVAPLIFISAPSPAVFWISAVIVVAMALWQGGESSHQLKFSKPYKFGEFFFTLFSCIVWLRPVERKLLFPVHVLRVVAQLASQLNHADFHQVTQFSSLSHYSWRQIIMAGRLYLPYEENKEYQTMETQNFSFFPLWRWELSFRAINKIVLFDW